MDFLQLQVGGVLTVGQGLALGSVLLLLYFGFRLVSSMFVPKPSSTLHAKMQCASCGWKGTVSKHKSRCAQCGGTVLTPAG